MMRTMAMRTMMDTSFIIIFMAFVFMAVASRVRGSVRVKVEWAWEGGGKGGGGGRGGGGGGGGGEGGEVMGVGHVGEGGVNDNNSIDVSLMWLLLSTSLLLLVWVRRQEEGRDGRC